jgi:hypothetical protein
MFLVGYSRCGDARKSQDSALTDAPENEQGLLLTQHELRVEDLIRNGILNLNSEMRKAGHRLKPLFVSTQLIESYAELLNEQIQRGKEAIGKVFFAQFLPDMLRRIDLRTVSGLVEQANVLWNDQGFGAMPSGLIDLDDQKKVSKGCRDVFEKEIHHRSVGTREH